MELVWLFIATFSNIFLLGLQSQFVRDQRVAMCFAVSWGISAAQFTFTRVIAGTDNPATAFMVSGWAGAIGICSSIYFYKWFHPRYQSWQAGKGWCK